MTDYLPARTINPELIVHPGYTDADFAITPETAALLFDSRPANTTAAYTWAWDRFTDWCDDARRVALPATPQTLADYITIMIKADLAPNTIDQAIGAIRSTHTRHGHDRQPNTTAALDLLRAYKRTWADNGNRVRKSKPILLDALRAMIDTCEPGKPADIRDRALLLLGFNIMARRSELSALNVTDLSVDSDGLTVYIRHSKTDQAAVGVEVAVPYGQHQRTCAVRACADWFSLLASRGLIDGPVFRPIDRHGRIGNETAAAGRVATRLSGKSVSGVVRRRAILAGLPNAEEYTGHGLRAGGVTVAYAAGVPVSTIARHGRWSEKSPVVLGYIRAVDKWADNAMRGIGL